MIWFVVIEIISLRLSLILLSYNNHNHEKKYCILDLLSLNYLDDHDMVRMLPRLIEDSVARDHVINNVAFGDFFGAEGLWGREVHAVIVSQVVVAHYGCWLSQPSHIKI